VGEADLDHFTQHRPRRAGIGVGHDHLCRADDRRRVAADGGAVLVQDPAAPGELVVRRFRHVPDVGVLGDHPQRPPAPVADEDRQLSGRHAHRVRLERLLCPHATGQRAGRRQAGDSLVRRHERQPVAGGAAGDQQSEADPRGPRGPRGERAEQRPALEGRPGRVAVQRHEVVPQPGVLDGLTPGELAARLGVATPTVVKSATRMAAAGLLTRRRDDTDARLVRLHLTDHARRARAHRVRPGPAGLRIAETLTDEERRLLRGALTKIIDELSDTGK
jgi:DNA-binding MarR family transcriptional regulator